MTIAEIHRRLDQLAAEDRDLRATIDAADARLAADPHDADAAGTAVIAERRLAATELEEQELRALLARARGER